MCYTVGYASATPFLLPEKPVLDELVDECEDNRVNGSLGRETGPGREGEENTRGEDEEEESSRNKIPHLFASTTENL